MQRAIIYCCLRWAHLIRSVGSLLGGGPKIELTGKSFASPFGDVLLCILL